MRIYDTRLGKFLSVDPLVKKFPWYSPYHFSGNNPIQNVDLDGSEEENYLIHALKVFLGLAPKPTTAEEAHYDANEREAINKTKDDVKRLAEVYGDVYGFILPGYSAGLNASENQYGKAGLLIVADMFGGRLVGSVVKGIGMRLPVTLATINKGLLGDGLVHFERIIAKVEAQASKINDETVTGAAKELLGIPIENPKVNPDPMGHLKKVQQALKGIKNSIDQLRANIANGTFTGDIAKEANRVANQLQKEKDRIQNQLARAAAKGAEKSK